MKDHFSTLGFSRTLCLEPESVEKSWREATRRNAENSDAVSEASENDALALHEARAALTNPVERLAHWLALHGVEPTRSTSMDPGMMDLFGSLDGTLSKTDNFLSRQKAATTALAKALLTKEALQIQVGLQDQMQRIQARKRNAVDCFPDLEKRADQGEFEKAISILQQLQFLSKWESQCQGRLLSLLDC